MSLLFLAAAVMPFVPAPPLASDFTLAPPSPPLTLRGRAPASTPVAPARLRASDFEVPEIEIALAENGPIVMLGALGGRHANMPKLAHVALGWTF